MKKNKQTLSVVLATYNEESNIKKCLQSIKNIADEIIVVDGDSTDNTRQMAKSQGAKVYRTTNKPNFHINKQKAIDKAKCDWVLQLDADEVITSALRQEILETINSNPPEAAFYIKRKNFFLGRFLKKGGQYPDPVIRLFKNGKAKLPQKDVHEQIKVAGQVGTLNHPMEHFTAPTFDRYIQNANRYTSLTAKKLRSQNVPISFISTVNYMLVKPFKTFFLIYFRHKGFVDGFAGFVFALFSGLHHTIAYFKYWELENRGERVEGRG